MMATNYYDAAKETAEAYRKQVEESKQESIDEVNTQSDERIAAAVKSTQQQKEQTDSDYIDIINDAAIQKELDLRDIRETRANMGLSRSGLSSTEQTAAILSAGNKTAEAQRQRQAAIDALKQSLEEYKIAVEDERRSNILSINQSAEENVSAYESELTQKAMDLTSKDTIAQIEAEESVKKAQIEAQQKATANAESTRTATLKTLLTASSIDSSTYVSALENGWTASYALNYQGLSDAKGDGRLSSAVFSQASIEGCSVDTAMEAQEWYAKYASEVQKGNRQWAFNALNDAVVSGASGSQAFTVVVNALGFTQEEAETYKNQKPASVSLAGGVKAQLKAEYR